MRWAQSILTDNGIVTGLYVGDSDQLVTLDEWEASREGMICTKDGNRSRVSERRRTV